MYLGIVLFIVITVVRKPSEAATSKGVALVDWKVLITKLEPFEGQHVYLNDHCSSSKSRNHC